MFTDQEYEILTGCYQQCLKSVQNYRQLHNAPLKNIPFAQLYQPFLEVYKQLTGEEASFEPDEIMRRHYLSRWKTTKEK